MPATPLVAKYGWLTTPTKAVIHLMHVTRDAQHDFWILQLKLLNDAGLGLADVEAVAVRRKTVNVMKQLVAVSHLNRLSNPRTDDPGNVHARTLVDRHRLGGNRRRWKRSLQAHKDIGQAAVGGCGDDFLHRAFPGVELRAHRIHPHPDDRIAGERSLHSNVTFDRAALGRLRRLVRRPIGAGAAGLQFPRRRVFRRIPVVLVAGFAGALDSVASVEKTLGILCVDRVQRRHRRVVEPIDQSGPGGAGSSAISF